MYLINTCKILTTTFIKGAKNQQLLLVKDSKYIRKVIKFQIKISQDTWKSRWPLYKHNTHTEEHRCTYKDR